MPKAPLKLLPKGALKILYEAARHILRRPVIGVAAAARTPSGEWLLIRRADTGEWALPGGTIEWGETLRVALARELLEEAGVERADIVRLVGVYSRPDRDPRFHGVTVVVECAIDPPTRAPDNPLEILESRLFAPDALPKTLAMGMEDMLAAAVARAEPVIE